MVTLDHIKESNWINSNKNEVVFRDTGCHPAKQLNINQILLFKSLGTPNSTCIKDCLIITYFISLLLVVIVTSVLHPVENHQNMTC